MTKRILVIEDQDLMRESLYESLERVGYRVLVAARGEEGVQAFERGGIDAVITDLRLPGLDGLEVLRRIKTLQPRAPVVMITAHGSVKNAVEAMKLGADDYITKPFNVDELEVVIARCLDRSGLLEENALLKDELNAAQPFDIVIGQSPAMRRIIETVRRVAATDTTVMICGESGTGKEVVARALHHWGGRAERPMLCVNCAALSAGLLESELFGHERGAFTGADKARKGRFELAAGGTLLLDEVTEIDINLQAKLLRVLQERAFERVGSSESIEVDVRVVATSNRDLAAAVVAGRLREDLYYRLNVVPIKLPPLRQRREDIPDLVRAFVERCARRFNRPGLRVSGEALGLLLAYDWPGNVRELQNIIERACVLSGEDVVGPEVIAPGLERGRAGAAEADPTEKVDGLVGQSLEDVERELIRGTLGLHGGHQVRTAQTLGIGVRTLRNKIKKWGLR